MGGDISVTSIIGKGSCFEINLLFKPGNDNELTLPIYNLKNIHILVVDDNETNRFLVREQIEKWGARVTTAADGETALTLLKNNISDDHRIAAAVLDMQMPNMDGTTLSKLIRMDEKFSELKLIMMTSMGARGDASYFAQLGFSAYFAKPAKMKDLGDSLAVVLDNGEALERAQPLVTQNYLNTLRHHSHDEPIQSVYPRSNILLVEDNPVNQWPRLL